MPAVVPVDDASIVLNGVRFHYREWGEPHLPPLVILHALGDSARDWDGVAEAMADDFRVLVLDQRGHGETWWAPDYSAGTWAEDLEAFALTLGLRAMALFGHGMGARQAMRYAARNRSVVKRLVLVDEPPPALPALEDDSPAVRCADFPSPREAAWELSNELGWANPALLKRWTLNKFREGAPGRWELRWDARMRLPVPGGNGDRIDEDAELRRQVTCPALVVRSADRKAHPGTQTISGAAHVHLIESHHPLLEEPEGLTRAVRDWL
jgi:pimeloyl-ACP methyl ester carboxylesterase